MALIASAILGKVSKILQDEGTVRRWPTDTELLGWLDSAQREIAMIRPELFSTTAVRKLVAGTLQTLPATAVALVAATRNMGTDGTTVGQAIADKPAELLDILLPDWHTHAARAKVRYVSHDAKNPKQYFVYPPQPAANQGYVEEVLRVAPTALASASATIGLDDIYENVLINLVLYRAYAKDSDIPRAAERSNTYRAAALEGIGLQLQATAANTPGGDQ